MADDVTEWIEITPEELHLVGTAANGFKSPLVAKAAEPRKVTKMKSKIGESTKTLAKAVQTESVELSSQVANHLAEQAIQGMRREAKKAEKQGPLGEARAKDIKQAVAKFKLELFENERQHRPGHGQVAPGIVRLPFDRSPGTVLNALGTDTQVGGV